MEYYCTVSASQRGYSWSSKFMQGQGSEYPKGKPNSVKQHKAQSALVSTMVIKKCLLKADSAWILMKSYLQLINLKNKNFTLFSIFKTHSPGWTMNNRSIRISGNSFLLTRPDIAVFTTSHSSKESCKGALKAITWKWFAKRNHFMIWGKSGQLLKTSASQLMKTVWQHLLQRLFPARNETPSAWPEKGKQGVCTEQEFLISPSEWGQSQGSMGKQTIKNNCVKNWINGANKQWNKPKVSTSTEVKSLESQ